MLRYFRQHLFPRATTFFLRSLAVLDVPSLHVAVSGYGKGIAARSLYSEFSFDSAENKRFKFGPAAAAETME